MIGSKVGRYTIEEKLGNGAMGDVYLGVDHNQGENVAIKFLKVQLHSNERLRFAKEARILASLKHYAIIPLMESNQITTPFGTQPYLIMPLMRSSLYDLIKQSKGPLDPEVVLKVVERVGSGLDYAHAKGIVHRDLKPSNIFFDQNKNAYIGDFGIAKIMDSETVLTSGIIGTPNYMSPEQIVNSELDHRSDIYSFGCVTFEMLTGTIPFGDLKNFHDIMTAHRTQHLPFISSINPMVPYTVDAVIEKAVRKKPKERFKSMEEFSQELITALNDELFLDPDGSKSFQQPLQPAAPDYSHPIIINHDAALGSSEEPIVEAEASVSEKPPFFSRWWMPAVLMISILIGTFFAGSYFFASPADSLVNDSGESGTKANDSTGAAGLPTPAVVTVETNDEQLAEEAVSSDPLTEPPSAATAAAEPIVIVPTPQTFAVINSVDDAIVQLDNQMLPIPDSGVFSIEFNQTMMMQSLREPIDLRLPNKTFFSLDEVSAAEFYGENLDLIFLSGSAIIINHSNIASFLINENMSRVEVDRGELGVLFDKSQNLVRIDCLMGQCAYQESDGVGNKQPFTTNEAVIFDLDSNIVMVQPADYTLYDGLGGSIRRSVAPTPTPQPTSTATSTPSATETPAPSPTLASPTSAPVVIQPIVILEPTGGWYQEIVPFRWTGGLAPFTLTFTNTESGNSCSRRTFSETASTNSFSVPAANLGGACYGTWEVTITDQTGKSGLAKFGYDIGGSSGSTDSGGSGNTGGGPPTPAP